MPLFGPPNVDKLKAKGKTKDLLKLLAKDGYKHKKLRSAAMKALGELADPDSIDTLTAYYNKKKYDRSERLEIARALVNIGKTLRQKGNPLGLKPLVLVFGDKEYSVRKLAADAFVMLGPDSIPTLAEFNKDKNWETRQFAIQTIGKFGDLSIPSLKSALCSTDKTLHQSAAQELIKLNWQPTEDAAGAWYWMHKKDWKRCAAIGKPAIDPLGYALKDGYEEIAIALGNIADSAAIPILENYLSSGNVAKTLQASVISLGKIGGPEAIESLVRATANSKSNIAETAANVLCQFKDMQGANALIESLNVDVGMNLEIYRNQQFEVSKKALVSLGNQVLPALVKSMEKKEPGHILAILVTLGEIGDPQALPVILPFLKSEKIEFVVMATRASGEIGDPGAQSELVKALTHRNAFVRQAVVNALEKTNWQPENDQTGARYWFIKKNWTKIIEIGNPAVDLLLSSLEDPDSKIDRPQIIEALGKIGDSRAVGPLIPLLKDDSLTVRKQTVIALGDLRNPKAIKSIENILNDRMESVRLAAYAALGKIGGEESIKILIQSLPVPRAAEALREIGRPAVESLIVQLQSEDHGVRRISAETLGAIGDHRAVEPLLDLLKDEQVNISRAATLALGQIGGSIALTKLLDQLDVCDNEILRQSTIVALANITDQTAVRPLLRILQDEQESYAVKSTIIDQLKKFQDPSIVDVLISLVVDDNAKHQSEAMIALGDIGNERAVDILIQQIPSVVAMYALGKIGDPRAVQPLIKMIPDANFSDFQNILNVLAMLYRSGKLDENHKQLILKQGSALKRREDYYTHEDEGCFGERIHTDNHADFHKMI